MAAWGLEPRPLAGQDPKSSASANSATLACAYAETVCVGFGTSSSTYPPAREAPARRRVQLDGFRAGNRKPAHYFDGQWPCCRVVRNAGGMTSGVQPTCMLASFSVTPAICIPVIAVRRKSCMVNVGTVSGCAASLAL